MPYADLDRFRLLAQATGDAICDWDIVNDRSWLSESWQRLYGPVDGEKLDTPTWLGMVHPDDRPRLERELTQAIAGDAVQWTGEYRFRRADGRYAHILERACILRDETGRATRLLAAMTDLTAHKQTEQALRDSERMLHELTTHINECFWVHDVQKQRGIYISPAAERIWGLPLEAMRQDATSFLAVVHPDDREAVTATWQCQREAREIDVEYRIFRHGDGELRWVQTRAFPVYDDAGRFYRICGISRDITAQKLEEARLRESEEHHRHVAESNRRLLDEVNHRVRNNLASLRSLIRLTRTEASTPEAFAEALDRRVSAMARVHGLLADAAWRDLDLRTLIESVHRPIDTPHQNGHTLCLSGPPVRLTPRQAVPLAMTLMELSTNSGKHGALSTPGGRVEVAWRLDDGRLHLRWREAGGPPVQPPASRSVGTDLIEGFIRFELAGQCDLRYPPSGADHVLEIPM